MKTTHILALLIFAVCSLTAVAATGSDNDDNRFIELINRYDVATLTNDIPADSTAAFWRRIGADDPSLKRFLKRIDRNGRQERKAINRIDMLPRFSIKSMLTGIDSLQQFADSLAEAMGFDMERCRIHVADHPWPMAAVALRSYGFAVLINSGLIQRCDSVMLMSVVAREYVHGLLLHHLRHEYEWICATRRKHLGNALLFSIAPYGYMIWNDLTAMHPDEDEALADRFAHLNVGEAFDSEIAAYLFPFGDDLEIQADIVAFRFMERRGLADRFISDIAILGKSRRGAGLEMIDNLPDRSLEFRQRLLRFMRENPSIEAYKKSRRRADAQSDPLYR